MEKNNKIEEIEIGWDNAVVMICTKCAKNFSEIPERLKSELKTITKTEMGKSARVITTSCLNMCPVDKIAIAIADNKKQLGFRGLAVLPETSGLELYQEIFKKN